jgi:6-pyruvoyltetrahydropterin/6-carboxytetrahydropterin synthase
MRITRKAEFSASHVCRNDAFSDEQNSALYGPAANPHGHGHNYIVEITIEGEPDPVTGMVRDLKEVKDILQREVIEPFDHRFLNREVPPFDRIVPTAENVAVEIWRRLQPSLDSTRSKLHSVKLHETSDLSVEYYGGPDDHRKPQV